MYLTSSTSDTFHSSFFFPQNLLKIYYIKSPLTIVVILYSKIPWGKLMYYNIEDSHSRTWGIHINVYGPSKMFNLLSRDVNGWISLECFLRISYINIVNKNFLNYIFQQVVADK